MRQSLDIINQVLNNMCEGPTKSDNFNIISDKNLILNSMENTINHYKLYSGLNLKSFSDYTATEAPKGEFGIFLITFEEKSRIYRSKIRAPGFFHLQGLDFMSKNHLLADVVTVIGSQYIVFGEIDR